MSSKEKVEVLNHLLKGLPAIQVLETLDRDFGNTIGFSTSLGAEDQVITSMIAGINRNFNIFTLDTGRMFPDTYDVLHRTANRYGMTIRVMFPEAASVERMVKEKGINLFFESIENRKFCCQIRKIEPLKRALSGLDAWITGLRRQQSITRHDLSLVEWDDTNQIIKINPLIDWTNEMVWDYIRNNNVPYNKLHDRGFPSIGCEPCTRAVEKGEDMRSGRWWWELPESKECGLHRPH
jgi:phosphoadenosine phosphosulfate reductase